MSSDHYFSPSPRSDSRTRTIRARLAGRDVDVVTSGGVFSPEHLDQGTRVLLDEVSAPPASGHLLDLGAGWGPIAISLALQSPDATVWAVDVNERALGLVRRNCARLGISNVNAVLPSDVPADLRFATIWSNPPIRIGKPALHDLLSRWLGRLADGGTACLVVQKHLGADSLARWLSEQGWRVTRLSSRAGYRILLVTAADQAVTTVTGR